MASDRLVTAGRCARPLVILMMVAMLLLGPPAFGTQAEGPVPAGGSGKISPDLQRLVVSNPGGEAHVIVEMNSSSTGFPSGREMPERAARDKIEQYGGVGWKKLGIIGGAAGKIPIGRVIALSRDPAVRYVSQDRQLVPTGSPFDGDMVDFARALNADQAWAKGYTGSRVTVAVLDSGVAALPNGIDPQRLVASVDLVSPSPASPDPGGHGTHVAGVIAGRGANWSGVAPQANIASIRVIDDNGHARVSTVIQGIQWAVQNRRAYNIRVINLSLGGPVGTSYRQDPLAAAVEMAWHAGVVVVAAAGNGGPGSGTIVTPAYDPYVVTVGSVDMNATVARSDDTPAFFSSRGPTVDGLSKPDVVAPGRKMVSTRVSGSFLDNLFPDRVVDTYFFRLSGTSQAAAAVSGVVALMLDANQGLQPDQVKRRLMASASPVPGYDANAVGAGLVDAYEAAKGGAVGKQSARPADAFAVQVFRLIKGVSPLKWRSLSFNGGVDSRGIPWSNVTWDNVTWDNVTWDNVAWDNVTWDNVTWDNVTWDNVTWDNITWDNVTWDSAEWNSVGSVD